MFGDDESVFDRLWARLIGDRFEYLVPLWIARRPESLVIFDYRPTGLGLLAGAGFAVMAVLFFLFLFVFTMSDSLGLWLTGITALVLLAVALKGTIREEYYFDRSEQTYAFVRQFIYRREVIEGSISQFTGAYVKTQQNEESESYSVVLKQQGMFLTGVSEQTLRAEVPIFNSYDREARIADAISSFLAADR